MSELLVHAKSMAACKHLLDQPEFARAQCLMIYLPLPAEVDLTPVALRGWQEQKVIAAPQILWDKRYMVPVEIHSMDTGMVVGRHGLREPAGGTPIPIDMLDLVIVPGMAFDRRGNRLGRGAGFYDRFLASKHFSGVAVSLAFREQIVEEIPVQANDRRVDMLVTDEEVLRFAPAEAGDGMEAGR